jgi:2-oxo-4-hydroxy-4-carboxy-5-ureidoimidazoline decarboxylase
MFAPMATKLDVETLNRMDAPAFAGALAHVFEHAPWVAERAAGRRPFRDREALHRAMTEVVRAAGQSEQEALICGHPELAGKAAIARDLTPDSSREQSGAGLDRLTRAEYERFHVLNTAYRKKFGFPFIMAVKGRNKDEILAAFGQRLENDRAIEFATALDQIGRIATFRLADLVDG